jgi:hypothetical protein
MSDVERWGVLTIGTGLGNARFTNIAARDTKKDQKDKMKGEKANGEKAKKKKKDKDREKEKEKV